MYKLTKIMSTFSLVHSLQMNGNNNTRVVNMHIDKDFVNISLDALIADNSNNNTRVVNIHIDKDYVNIFLDAFIADE